MQKRGTNYLENKLELAFVKTTYKVILTILTLFIFNTGLKSQTSYDIVIYGGTSAGISAAIQSSRMGKSVVLIEPTQRIGGLTIGGLGQTDIGNKQAIGGISREFYQNIKKGKARKLFPFFGIIRTIPASGNVYLAETAADVFGLVIEEMCVTGDEFPAETAVAGKFLPLLSQTAFLQVTFDKRQRGVFDHVTALGRNKLPITEKKFQHRQIVINRHLSLHLLQKTAAGGKKFVHQTKITGLVKFRLRFLRTAENVKRGNTGKIFFAGNVFAAFFNPEPFLMMFCINSISSAHNDIFLI